MHHSPLVILAERDAAVNLLMNTILARPGYRVIRTHSLDEGVDRVSLLHPDVFVVSVEMYTLERWIQQAQYLLEHRYTTITSVLVCSGCVDVMEYYRTAARKSQELFLAKPFGAIELREAVQRLLVHSC